MMPAMMPTPSTPRAVLRPYNAPGIFVTAVGTDIGKTTVTAALAAALRQLHIRVGVCKPVSSGCRLRAQRAGRPALERPMTDDDFESSDGIQLARAAGFDPDDESIMQFVSPIRYAAPVSPALASQLEDRAPDWHRVAAAMDFWQENCDLLLVEGAGGWYVPIHPPPHDFMIADLAAALRLPCLVVTNAVLGSINLTLLTIHAILEKNLPAIGLVINGVPPVEQRDLAMISNLAELPRLAGVPLRATLPQHSGPVTIPPPAFVDALLPFARDWWNMVRPEA
jgi:dethiobiotin synthetase